MYYCIYTGSCRQRTASQYLRSTSTHLLNMVKGYITRYQDRASINGAVRKARDTAGRGWSFNIPTTLPLSVLFQQSQQIRSTLSICSIPTKPTNSFQVSRALARVWRARAAPSSASFTSCLSPRSFFRLPGGGEFPNEALSSDFRHVWRLFCLFRRLSRGKRSCANSMQPRLRSSALWRWRRLRRRRLWRRLQQRQHLRSLFLQMQRRKKKRFFAMAIPARDGL